MRVFSLRRWPTARPLPPWPSDAVQPKSRQLAEAKPTFFSGVSVMTQGRFLSGMGALPILKQERCLGAVGVSGAKAEQDQEIAQACIQAL